MKRRTLLSVLVVVALAVLAGIVAAQLSLPVVWVAVTEADGTGLTGYTNHYGAASGRADGAERWTDIQAPEAIHARDAVQVQMASTDGNGPTGTVVLYRVTAREPLPDGTLRLWLARN